MASFSILTALWIIKTSQAKERSKEKQRESKENRGQQLQSSFALLEHFPKSILYMLYTISKLRKSKIQCFKRCAIRSWNEEVAAITSQSLRAEGSILQSVAKSPFCCEVISQPFCTVWWISSWSCPIYAANWKLSTSRWKPTSQPYENTLLLRSDLAAFLNSVIFLLLTMPDLCREKEARNLKVEANFTALRV